MFLRFSRTLVHHASMINATSLYFGIRRLWHTFLPGHRALSFHDFFHRSGCISLLNTYAGIMQGTNEHVEALIQPKARWVYTHTPASHATALWLFSPSRDEILQGFIAVDAGSVVQVVESETPKSGNPEDVNVVVEMANGRRGKIPTCCMSRRVIGCWHVECDADAAASSPRSRDYGFDNACAAAMRACSGGLMMTLVLRLGCDRCSAVRDPRMDFVVNRLILARIAGARSSHLIKVPSSPFHSVKLDFHLILHAQRHFRLIPTHIHA
jgi:hypothetical protein